jgi:hypothetical protein
MFFIVYLYIYWRSSYQEGRVEIPLTGLTPQLYKESLISDGQQMHQYQQNEHFNSLNIKRP